MTYRAPLLPVVSRVVGVQMAMVYAAAPLTTGQFNPAVSVAIWLRGRLSLSNLVYFVGSQILGGIIGAACSQYWMGSEAFLAATPQPGIDPVTGLRVSEDRAFLGELMYALLVVLASLHTTTAENNKGNNFFGMCIGYAVMSGRLAVTNFSGGVFNPAIVSGLYAVSNSSASLWLYWVAPMFAAGIGAFFFMIMVPSEFSKDIPSFVQVVLQDWHVSKYFTEFICTWFLTMSAVLGNGGSCCCSPCASL